MTQYYDTLTRHRSRRVFWLGGTALVMMVCLVLGASMSTMSQGWLVSAFVGLAWVWVVSLLERRWRRLDREQPQPT